MCASQKVQVFFYFLPTRKSFPAPTVPSTSRCSKRFHFFSQNTSIVVNGAEHQQTVIIKKLGQKTSYSEVLIVISWIFAMKDTLKNTLTLEAKLICLSKAHKARLKNSLTEKYSALIEQTRTPFKLIIEKIWCRYRKEKFCAVLQFSVHTDTKSMEKTLFQQKTPESNYL